ncbi:hypothetical protein ACEWY4_021512 [Coilia grayii]|uniref:Myb/SANT-like DNA-binding domain-containing protein n=1 Tax=Coilia grayii TaxID=363190 RepID=A0ABD1JAG7_9TELE
MSEEKRNNWSRAETLLFLTAIWEADVISALDGKRQRNADVFKKLSAVLSQRGMDKNWEALRNKWKTMKARYLADKRASMKSGTKGKINYAFWEEMDVILGSRPVVTATHEATNPKAYKIEPCYFYRHSNDGEMDNPDAPQMGGSLFRRPLKRKATPAQQLNQMMAEMIARNKRQEERDREMLQSIVTSVNRLVQCIEKQTTQASIPSTHPFAHSQPGPSYHHQSFLYMQQQPQQHSTYTEL